MDEVIEPVFPCFAFRPPGLRGLDGFQSVRAPRETRPRDAVDLVRRALLVPSWRRR